MIDFSDQTYQGIRAQMLALLPSSYDLRDTQPMPTAISPAAYVAQALFMNLDQIQQQAAVQTAVGQWLDLLAPLGGISRDQASAAVVLGVFNMAVPLGSRFSTINGSDSIDLTVTSAVGSNQFQLTADTPGSIGNEYTGPILPITAIPGLTSAQITQILVPGEDVETDDSLRARLLTALNDRPFGGNIASYRENILPIEGVGAVQIYPTWNGGGTVKCSILGADYTPASPTLVENVQNAIDPPPNQGLGLGLAPIGAQVTITAPEAVEVNVSATLTLQPGYQIGQVQVPIENAISAYLLTVSQEWSTNISTTSVQYAANVYVARITAAIVGVTGVVNATGVQLNGGTEDLILTETGTLQQVPALGEVTLST